MDLFESINAGVMNRERKVKEAEGRLEGGQVHYACGEEFMPECSRGAGVLSGSAA